MLPKLLPSQYIDTKLGENPKVHILKSVFRGIKPLEHLAPHHIKDLPFNTKAFQGKS